MLGNHVGGVIYDLQGCFCAILFHDLFMYILLQCWVDLAEIGFYRKLVVASIGRHQSPFTSFAFRELYRNGWNKKRVGLQLSTYSRKNDLKIGIFLENHKQLRNISCIPKIKYIRHIACIIQAYIRNILYKSLAYYRHISRKSQKKNQAYFRQISTISQISGKIFRKIPDVSHSYIRDISGRSHVYIW